MNDRDQKRSLRAIEGGEHQSESISTMNPSWELDVTDYMHLLPVEFPPMPDVKFKLICVPRICQFIFMKVEKDGNVSSSFFVGGMVNLAMMDSSLPPSKSDLDCVEAVEVMLKAIPGELAKEMLAVANVGAIRRAYNFGLREIALQKNLGI